MGTIISQKLMPDHKVKIRVKVDIDEALVLRGNVNKVHLFSRDLPNIESKIIEKGKDGVTKYFSVPYEFREKPKKMSKEISCQKIETDTKVIFVYVIDKENLSI
jgi:hypothetical protein